jgi:hypothetical protein
MGALRALESHVNIDIAGLFSSGLHQQMLLEEGQSTAALHFVEFYRVLAGSHLAGSGIIYSPTRRAFLNRGTGCPLRVEEYTDPSELRALCIMLGPSGIKQLLAEINGCIGGQMGEIKKLIIANRVSLDMIRKQTGNTSVVADALRRLTSKSSSFVPLSSLLHGAIINLTCSYPTGLDEVLARICHVGMLLSFRNLVYEALRDMLSTRAQFIFKAIDALHRHTTHTEELDTLATHAGLLSDIDPLIVRAVAPHCSNSPAEFSTWSLFPTLCAIALRAYALSPGTVYQPPLGALENNAHVLATVVNQIGAATMAIVAPEGSAPEDVICAALHDFVRISGISLLRLVAAPGGDMRSRDGAIVVLDMVSGFCWYILPAAGGLKHNRHVLWGAFFLIF